jgi:uncharacterized membrane protein HdeD (DUF308 family)
MGWAGDTGPVKLSRLAAAGGVAGPVLFTVAWVVSSLRQAGHSAAGVQLSGLAAEDARDPQIMMAGFVVLGAGTVVFGAGLGRVTAPRSAGPWLVVVAGVASVAAGLFRRDHMLLAGPGFAGESWHNQVHDVVSGVAYGAMLAAPLVLGRRMRDDPEWAALSRPVQVLALVSAVALGVFASGIAGPYNGVVQRIAVTLALTAEILLAGRMLTLPVIGSPAVCGRWPFGRCPSRGWPWARCRWRRPNASRSSPRSARCPAYQAADRERRARILLGQTPALLRMPR